MGTAVEGYATTGGDRRVTDVEVSGNGGAGWVAAQLLDTPVPGVWVRWRSTLKIAAGEHELVARARDSGGRTQPEHVRDRWNPKGYMNDAWHRVRITLDLRCLTLESGRRDRDGDMDDGRRCQRHPG